MWHALPVEDGVALRSLGDAMNGRPVAAGCLLVAGCLPGPLDGANPNDGPEPRPVDASLVALGDSVFAFHRETDQDIPHVVGRELGVGVYNVSVSGAQITGGDDPIPDQLPDGPWEWVLVDGGANDLADRCGCGDCDAVLDEMITADGSAGLIPQLAARVVEAGSQLAVMGYYTLPGDAPDFEGCDPWIDALSARQEALAASDPGVFFTAASEVVDGTDLAMFFPDKVHPSVAGAEIIGTHVAGRMREAN